MGRPMAARLFAKGFPLRVFDERREAVEAFVSMHGGKPTSSPARLAEGRDVVITMLPDGNAVRQVTIGDGEGKVDCLLDTMPPGSVLIDMGSSAPLQTKALGVTLAQHGVHMLDAPVSGGVGRASAGTLAVMVGGDPAVIERCRPILAALGEHVFEVGRLGSGHALKALNNLVSAAGFLAAAEALLVGRKFGIEPRVMIDVLNASTGRNNSTEQKFKQFILSRAFNSSFSLELMVKDLSTALDLARSTSTPAPLSALCRELWAAAAAHLESGADHTAMVRWLEQLAGVTLEG